MVLLLQLDYLADQILVVHLYGGQNSMQSFLLMLYLSQVSFTGCSSGRPFLF